MDYNAPSGSTDTNADYVGATASTQGSKIPPNVPMLTQRELVNVELLGGLTPANGDRTQVGQAIGRGLWLGTLGASPNALVGTLGAGAVPTKPGVLQTFNPWTRLRGLALQTNTQASVTLTVVGIGSAAGYVTAPLLKRDGSALSAGDVPTLYPFAVQVDASGNFRMEGAVASDGVSTSNAVPIAQASKSGFNTQPYQSTQRVSMATSGTNVLATAVSGLVFPKQSASSLVRVSGTFIVRTPHAPGNGYGPSYFLLNVGGTQVQQATNNGYPGVVNLTPVLAQLGTKASPLPKGNLGISLQFGRADASAWDAIFLPNSSDESGYPPSTLFQLFIDEVEPT